MESNRLDVDRIQERLDTRRVGRMLRVYAATASTNDAAWACAADPACDGLAIFAEEQTAGRGRHGNVWRSASGQSLLVSILLRNEPLRPDLLTLACAVATAQAIRVTAALFAAVKWPNDILINDRKVAGILIESRRIASRPAFVVGIGVNCHQQEEFFEACGLADSATSLDLQSGGRLDRNILAATLLNQLERWLSVAAMDPEQVVNEWKRLSSQLGRPIRLEHNGRRFFGTCIGVDPARGLILQLDTGGVRMFDAAHTAVVRPV